MFIAGYRRIHTESHTNIYIYYTRNMSGDLLVDPFGLKG